MNYVRTILIIVALLNMHHTYNGQMPNNSEDTIESLLESIPVAEPQAETTQENNLQAWNDHLALLTSNDENWNAATNNPQPDWKTQAFNLAEKVIKQDTSLAETLKTDFIAALNKKTTNFLDINNLVTEFSNFIDNLLATTQVPQDTQESTPPSPIVPDITIPSISEPITETAALATSGSDTSSSSSSEGETTSSAASEQNDQEPNNQEQLEKTWSEQLEKIKTEGENWVQIDDILNKTYEAAKELLKIGKVKENKLQNDFRAALSERSVREKIKPLYHLNIDDTLYYFNNSIGAFSGLSQSQFNEPYRFPEPSAFEPMGPDQPQKEISDARDKKRDEEFEKLKKEYAAKDAKFKEFEKEQQKAKEERMIALKAAQEAREKGELAQEQVHKLAQAHKKLEEEYEAKRKQDQKDIADARKSLLAYTEQMAAAQKAEDEKGILAKAADWGKWLIGASTEKLEGPSSKDQENFLNQLVKDIPHHLKPAAQQAFIDFQTTLLGFNSSQFWDAQRSLPNITWIARMDDLIKDVVITYKLMSLPEISGFIENILQKSGKISPSSLTSIMPKIQTKTNQALAQEKFEREAAQQKEQRRKEKKEQILLTQQRIQAEKERVEAENKRRIASAHTYKQEKKHWYNLLDTVAQNKQATPQENHAHVQRALEKSQSLLQLAGDIPHKDKARLSQKLKQKFSVALLNQQKNDDQSTNVYHNMDIFNKEINKMLD